MYLLSVPSVSSRYFNKIKRTSYLGKIARLIARNSFGHVTMSLRAMLILHLVMNKKLLNSVFEAHKMLYDYAAD